MSLSLQERQERSAQVTQQLKKYLSQKRGKWGAFTPLSSEPQIDWVQVSAVIDWYFVDVQQDRLKFVCKQLNDQPNSQSILTACELDGFCIPGLGFHLNGARLGRGGGYYDRELETVEKNKSKVGIAFDFTVSENLPYESHDVKVDVIVTDRRIIQAT